MDIHTHAEKTIREYGTNDPVELADLLDFQLYYHELGSINGYYLMYRNVGNIVVNTKLPRHVQKFIIGHEIGHSILHPNNNSFLMSSMYHTDRQELEADIFAINLLLTDSMVNDNKERTVDEWASILGLPRQIVELKWR